MIKESQLFKNVWCITDAITDSDKTTRIWGDTNGSATATDRIVILSDINPFQKFADNSEVELMDFDFVKDSTRYFIGS